MPNFATEMVSIVVTTHNYGHYLAETLISVKEQVYSNWECIVVDSGSTDNTKEIIKQFLDDKRFTYIYKNDHGVSAARNTGLKLCKGEYIQLLDGDDLLQKDKIAEHVKVLDENVNIDIVYSDARFFDDGTPGVLRTSKTGNKSDDWLPKISGHGEVVMKILRSFNFLVTHAPLFRKNILDRCGMFDEQMAALEDWDFWLRCANHYCYFHFHPGLYCLALVRVHSNSLSRKSALMLYGNFTMIHKMILSEKTELKHRVFFLFKFTELFWDTFFSPLRLPKISPTFILLSILLFPVWIIIKLARKIKII
jgi:glycosyltransferase involved in cell wall biosynthesis